MDNDAQDGCRINRPRCQSSATTCIKTRDSTLQFSHFHPMSFHPNEFSYHSRFYTRKEGICSYLNSLPVGRVSPVPSIMGVHPCPINLEHTGFIDMLNEVEWKDGEDEREGVMDIARILCSDSPLYSMDWMPGQESTPCLSFWWRIDDRGFPNYPDAQYALFLFIDSDDVDGPLDIAFNLLRILKAVNREYGVTKIVGFAHAVTSAGAFAFLLFERGGWHARHLDFYLDEPSPDGDLHPPIRFGYHVVARPRDFIERLDDKLYEQLMAVRLFLIDRRAGHPELYTFLGMRYEPLVQADGRVKGIDPDF
ncbi:hypothetical protein PENSPDRAFT_754041 [Peniophora sp. CONT]|nr:hypothetical protein PENSPDRAFT_754041 [Peniophora sp. CONT]